MHADGTFADGQPGGLPSGGADARQPAASDSPISATLQARTSLYGDFRDEAQIAQCLKRVMQQSPNWQKKRLNDSQTQALEMIIVKMARILNGDPNHPDNWHDLAGYALLVEARLPKREPPAA